MAAAGRPADLEPGLLKLDDREPSERKRRDTDQGGDHDDSASPGSPKLYGKESDEGSERDGGQDDGPADPPSLGRSSPDPKGEPKCPLMRVCGGRRDGTLNFRSLRNTLMTRAASTDQWVERDAGNADSRCYARTAKIALVEQGEAQPVPLRARSGSDIGCASGSEDTGRIWATSDCLGRSLSVHSPRAPDGNGTTGSTIRQPPSTGWRQMCGLDGKAIDVLMRRRRQSAPDDCLRPGRRGHRMKLHGNAPRHEGQAEDG